jgi:NAD(P)H-hydrate epimerase
MLPILTSKQIGSADKYTIKHEPISSINLMERAASCGYKIIRELLKSHQQICKIHIFCGVGNNGGDGLAIARMFINDGFTPEIYKVYFSHKTSDNFQTNVIRLTELNAKIKNIERENNFPCISKDDLIIDSIFGTGLSRPAASFTAELIQHINQSHATVFSIDVPSGLFSDGEENQKNNAIIKANVTLTFQTPKLSFLFPQTGNFAGKFKIVDIGLDYDFIASQQTNYFYIEKSDIQNIIKDRPIFSHKGNFGKALLVCGSEGMMGAAILSSKACLRSGVGLLTVKIPMGGNVIVQKAVPEAITLPDKAEKNITTPIPTQGYTAIGLGPGLGTHEDTSFTIESFLENITKPIVIDADALNMMSNNMDWLSKLPEHSILTPHVGEFRRLVGDWKNDNDRLKKLIKLSTQYKVYTILKGAYSSIACPNGNVYFNSTGNSGMATAGSGDVLTGILTGLLAQGYSSEEVCILGTYLHGLSGDMAMKEVGQTSLIARDIIENISTAFCNLKDT